MLDYAEYTIDGDGYQGNGHNGYGKPEGNWLTYHKVGKGFVRRVRREDRKDFLHDLFSAFARVKASYDSKGKELTTGGLVRVAQHAVSEYWRKWFKRIYGRDCSRCSKAQRQRCKEDDLYSQCPKAIQFESLNELIEDGQGDKTELCQLIADDNSDFTDRLDATLILESYPKRFVDLAYKKYAGYSLTNTERGYYRRELRKAQETLV